MLNVVSVVLTEVEVTVVAVGDVIGGEMPVPGQEAVLLGLPDSSCEVPASRTESVSATFAL